MTSVLAGFNVPVQGPPRALQLPPALGLQTTPVSIPCLALHWLQGKDDHGPSKQTLHVKKVHY